MTTTPLTSTNFRGALSHFATGVTVITAERAPGLVHGMTANSLASVSLEPPLILVCIAEHAQMLALLHERRRFGVNVLRADQAAISRFFSQPEQPEHDEKALGVSFRWTAHGIPLLQNTLVQMECHVVASYLAGDHTIFVGEVHSAKISPGEPLLYYRGNYRSLAPD
ncbi:MAG TPA: flavin reductase family protein [Candidatus Acidoferrum sp.]|nr:flavin reductase family protein [Candidatus Acidoferrum sp.]